MDRALSFSSAAASASSTTLASVTSADTSASRAPWSPRAPEPAEAERAVGEVLSLGQLLSDYPEARGVGRDGERLYLA